jgi:hypothetical protein
MFTARLINRGSNYRISSTIFEYGSIKGEHSRKSTVAYSNAIRYTAQQTIERTGYCYQWEVD